MRVDEVRARVEMHVPDFFVQLAARDYLTSMKHQVLEQTKFCRREKDLPPEN